MITEKIQHTVKLPSDILTFDVQLAERGYLYKDIVPKIETKFDYTVYGKTFSFKQSTISNQVVKLRPDLRRKKWSKKTSKTKSKTRYKKSKDIFELVASVLRKHKVSEEIIVDVFIDLNKNK